MTGFHSVCGYWHTTRELTLKYRIAPFKNAPRKFLWRYLASFAYINSIRIVLLLKCKACWVNWEKKKFKFGILKRNSGALTVAKLPVFWAIILQMCILHNITKSICSHLTYIIETQCCDGHTGKHIKSKYCQWLKIL